MLTISIVDDDSWVRNGIRQLVESLGYGARTFESAERFLESDAVEATNCLIADLQMPGLSGLGLQRVLKEQGYRIPVIFMDRISEIALGANLGVALSPATCIQNAAVAQPQAIVYIVSLFKEMKI